MYQNRRFTELRSSKQYGTTISSPAKISKHYGSFYIEDGKDTRTFKPISGGLWCYDPNDNGITFVTTVKENMEQFTPRDIHRAKQAKELYHAMMTTSIKD